MRRARVLLALGPFALPLLAAAIRSSRAQAPPRAAARATSAVRLATLAERIAKLGAQIGHGILVDRSRRGMTEAMRDFEATQRALLASAAAGTELREALQLLGLLWLDYRAWASKPPTRDNAHGLGERTEEIAWVAMKAARMLNATPRSATSALAFKAAEAGTLAQRIPRLYLWRAWGVRMTALAEDLKLSEALLQSTLASLRAVDSLGAEAAAEIQVAQDQAAFLAQAARQLDGGRDVARHLEFVAKGGDHILESMDRVVRLLETD